MKRLIIIMLIIVTGCVSVKISVDDSTGKETTQGIKINPSDTIGHHRR